MIIAKYKVHVHVRVHLFLHACVHVHTCCMLQVIMFNCPTFCVLGLMYIQYLIGTHLTSSDPSQLHAAVV